MFDSSLALRRNAPCFIPRLRIQRALRPVFLLLLFGVAEDFRELKELYALEESNIEHRSEGPKSDYYDPLVHGNRESNRQ